MTQPYPAPPYYFTSSNFLVLSNRFAAVVISARGEQHSRDQFVIADERLDERGTGPRQLNRVHIRSCRNKTVDDLRRVQDGCVMHCAPTLRVWLIDMDARTAQHRFDERRVSRLRRRREHLDPTCRNPSPTFRCLPRVPQNLLLAVVRIDRLSSRK